MQFDSSSRSRFAIFDKGRLLSIAVAERVGYDREGIELIAAFVSHGDLGAAIDLLQQTFVHTSFVSKRNVMKTVAKILEKFPDFEVNAEAERKPANATIDAGKDRLVRNHPPRRPLDRELVMERPTKLVDTLVLGRGMRCSICTLPPPCSHLNGESMIREARQRIQNLHRDPSMPICQSFARTGACEAMNKQGFCRMHHPPDLYEFVPAPRRCPICTIPEPCRTCPWFKLRRTVADVATRASVDLAQLKYKGSRSSVTLARFAACDHSTCRRKRNILSHIMLPLSSSRYLGFARYLIAKFSRWRICSRTWHDGLVPRRVW